METLKCPECGANVDADGGFCKYCGAKLTDNVERRSIEITDHARMEMVKLQRERFEREKEQEWKKERAKKIKIVLVLILLAAAVGGFFLVPDFLRGFYIYPAFIVMSLICVVLFGSPKKK